jgi:hypothetical protein
MKRVILLVMLLLGLSSGWPLASRAEDMNCKIECKTCASTCEQTLLYCSKHGNEHNGAAHVNAMKDCVSTCKQSADFMARGSSLDKRACALCEEACTACAASCDAFKGDKVMQDCAAECRKCAKVCHEMAG